MNMTVPAPPTTTDLLRQHDGPDRHATRRTGTERGASPREGERLRPLSRLQLEDRLQELGDFYAETSGGGPWAWNQARDAFLRRLAADVRRPGFELLVAETTELTGCAYGFPARADSAWEGPDAHLPGKLLSLAASGRLFVVRGILVPPRVRSQNQGRAWNLARRMQRRLLTDHGAVTGVTLVRRSDRATVEALRSWGWRYVRGDSPQESRALLRSPFRVLVLGT